MNIILPIKDIFIIAGNIVFSVYTMNILSSHAAANYYLQILKLCKSYILKKSYLLNALRKMIVVL